ncbi:cysteine hydrolase family protein [Actinomycetospora callitridis]|uniref:cysteine hydrolase family protein n=1 Tax=Actinomycetospora callitridis TaxID=913944 RepID=UPI002365DC74|nr:cysteine hydrolase [Actinomycetospora callitridis]MDD7917795.1 cysteine hydrolase [Actinomycetospora callitridis]
MPDALLVMDFQAGFLDLFDESEPVVARAAAALEATRRAAGPVVHLRVAFPPDGPPVPRANRMFGEQFRGRMVEGTDDVAVPDRLAPRPGEPVVTRRRTGPFAGSDLAPVLRGLGVDGLVLCGVSTGGVVTSTVCAAADEDLALTVLSDAVGDPDPDLHAALLRGLLPQHARVVTVAEHLGR